MSWFVTEPTGSQKRTAREEADAAASDATATIIAANDKPRPNITGFEAHLPAPIAVSTPAIFKGGP